MFNFDKSKANSFGLLPAGVYEVTIESAKLDSTRNGTEHIAISSVINQGQQYAGRKIFWKYWKVKEPCNEDLDTEGYSYKQIMQLCNACNFADGTEFNSIDDLLALIVRKSVKVSIEHTEYNGSKYERVKYVSECDKIKQSNAPAGLDSLEGFEEILDPDQVPF